MFKRLADRLSLRHQISLLAGTIGLAIVGVTYKLSDGRAYLRSVLGEVEDVPHGPGEEMVAI